MTDGGEATPAKAPAKKATKAKKPKKPANHPKYGDMIKAAISSLKERSGSSRQAIEKYIKANYKVDDKSHTYIKLALKMGVNSGKFVHTKGVGASGSFKLPSDAKEEKKKKPAKKPAKKAAAKKSPAKKPKKAAKKPAAKSPKKAKKSPAKKKPKKPAAKKASKPKKK